VSGEGTVEGGTVEGDSEDRIGGLDRREEVVEGIDGSIGEDNVRNVLCYDNHLMTEVSHFGMKVHKAR
jgi:hypothetical protein